MKWLENRPESMILGPLFWLFFWAKESIELPPRCRLVPDCSGAEAKRFRSIDGTCNNLARDVSWGSTGEVFDRLVKRSE